MKYADLQAMVQPGDWVLYYPHKNDMLDKLITGATFGPVNHASLVYDKDTIFETDGDMFKAGLTPMKDVETRHVLIFRPRGMYCKTSQFQDLCKEHIGLPYDYWALAVQGFFFWLNPPIREKVVSFLTFKKFLVCSELVAHVTLDTLPEYEELREWEGMNPEDLRKLALLIQTHYEFIGEYIPEA